MANPRFFRSLPHPVEAAKTGDSIASYSAYLERFPKGQFAALEQAAKQ